MPHYQLTLLVEREKSGEEVRLTHILEACDEAVARNAAVVWVYNIYNPAQHEHYKVHQVRVTGCGQLGGSND